VQWKHNSAAAEVADGGSGGGAVSLTQSTELRQGWRRAAAAAAAAPAKYVKHDFIDCLSGGGGVRRPVGGCGLPPSACLTKVDSETSLCSQAD
jgi:hypothetical protein